MNCFVAGIVSRPIQSENNGDHSCSYLLDVADFLGHFDW